MLKSILPGLILLCSAPAFANFRVQIAPMEIAPVVRVPRLGRPTLPHRGTPDFPVTPALLRTSGAVPSIRIPVPTVPVEKFAAVAVSIPDDSAWSRAVAVKPVAIDVELILHPRTARAARASEAAHRVFSHDPRAAKLDVRRLSEAFDGVRTEGGRTGVDLREDAQKEDAPPQEDPFRVWLLSTDSQPQTLPEHDLLREIGVPLN